MSVLIVSPEAKSGEGAFLLWADSALAGVPDFIAGFCFTIAETGAEYVVELVGSRVVTFNDPDWPCEEDFHAPVARLVVPYTRVSGGWEEMLEILRCWIAAYIDGSSQGALRLKRATAVTFCFVDGELIYALPLERA